MRRRQAAVSGRAAERAGTRRDGPAHRRDGPARVPDFAQLVDPRTRVRTLDVRLELTGFTRLAYLILKVCDEPLEPGMRHGSVDLDGARAVRRLY
jgi:hypothetical protein